MASQVDDEALPFSSFASVSRFPLLYLSPFPHLISTISLVYSTQCPQGLAACNLRATGTKTKCQAGRPIMEAGEMCSDLNGAERSARSTGPRCVIKITRDKGE